MSCGVSKPEVVENDLEGQLILQCQGPLKSGESSLINWILNNKQMTKMKDFYNIKLLKRH